MRTVRRLADLTLEWNCVSACPRMSYTLRRRRDRKRAMLKNSEWRDFVAVTSSVAVLGLGLRSLATGIGAHWIGYYAWVAVLWLMAVAFLVTLLAAEPSSRAGAAWLPKSRLPRA
jgi:hypothetical protein